jgi:XTP/dITP diphosphohydrolase
MPRLLVATRNVHKTAEIRALFGGGWDVLDLTARREIPSPEETGTTFAENAALKALSASRCFDGLVLGEDSGLEVEALGGAPGVFSARYARPSATDAENRARLLRELADRTETAGSAARFRCSMALAQNDQLLHACEGHVDGQIIAVERGEKGFGYDPVFVPGGYDLTFAELPLACKNQISHRAKALERVLAWLNQRALNSPPH